MGFVKDTLAGKLANLSRLRELCFYLGTQFVQPDSAVMDLGSDNGDAIAPFIDALPDDNSFVLVECDRKKLGTLAYRYAYDKRVKALGTDLTQNYPPFRPSLTLAVCTLQHIPLATRWRVLRSAYCSTLPGGALILVERVVSPGYLDELYSQQNNAQIYATQPLDPLSEGGAVTVAMNEQLLKDSGFRIVDCFYKDLGYAGWIAIKDE